MEIIKVFVREAHVVILNGQKLGPYLMPYLFCYNECGGCDGIVDVVRIIRR